MLSGQLVQVLAIHPRLPGRGGQVSVVPGYGETLGPLIVEGVVRGGRE